jgi:hypothetical protein
METSFGVKKTLGLFPKYFFLIFLNASFNIALVGE